MTLRPPRSGTKPAPVAALDYEIAQEQASALGRLGRALEAALAALSDYDSARAAPAARDAARAARDAARANLVAAASDALWCFMVQREDRQDENRKPSHD